MVAMSAELSRRLGKDVEKPIHVAAVESFLASTRGNPAQDLFGYLLSKKGMVLI